MDHTKTLLELDIEHDDVLEFSNDEFNLYVREDSAALQRSDELTGVSEKGRQSTLVGGRCDMSSNPLVYIVLGNSDLRVDSI